MPVGPARRRWLWIINCLSQVRVATPDTVRLLGGVNQQEEQSESARRHRTLFDGEAIDLPEQFVEGRSVGLAVATRTCRDAQSLDDPEGVVPLQSLDDASQRCGEPADVVVERKIFFSRRGRGWHASRYSLSH